MFVDAGSDANKWSQNLGEAGSCMRAFRKEFFSECSSEECFRYPESHRTNWLAIAAEPGETDFVDRSLPRRRFKSKSDIDKYLSRCVVCETIFKLVVVHTKTEKQAKCPSQYVSVLNPSRHIPNKNGAPVQEYWHGFSFWQMSQGTYGIGQNSESASSCLLYYTPTPVSTCAATGCKISVNTASRNFWQLNIYGERDEDLKPFFESEENIARCTVCRRPEAPNFKIVEYDN